jgi:glycosyltransferase involved in cell wall biosynthesis
MHFPLSIIIPTHKRTDILRQCLECLAKQSLLKKEKFEVVVVSDGPDEKTAEMIQMLPWPFEVQHFAIPKSQQGIARNRAAEKARGKISLLIGDDIFLAEDACEKHMKAHSDFPMAALGFTTWDPMLKVTPLMRWMEESGVQFGYPKIAEFAHAFLPKDRQHFFTYTSNLSLPTKLLWQYPFREDVSLYGWEDIEWGLRLADAGVSLFYEPDAKGYHHHAFTDAEVWERSRKLGLSAVKMQSLVGALRQSSGQASHALPLQIIPRGLKRIAYHLLALLPTYKGKHCRAFLRGMQQAK